MSSPIPMPLGKEPSFDEGRISQVAFKALIGTFYGLAILASSVRLILQIKVHRRLQLDDYLLVLASICLTGATVQGYVQIGTLYFSQTLNLNPTYFPYLLSEHVDIEAKINDYERVYYSYPAVLWTAIFVIKFAYLAFFRRLIERIGRLIIYWKIIVGITIISYPICVASIYLGCMKWGLDAAHCLDSYYFHRSLALAIADIILDVGTDCLMVSITVRLLWSVKIQAYQKFILGVFLSLNLFMAVTACIRVSGLSYQGTFDVVWLFVWQQIEACIAVSMISLTAFRSVFVGAEASRARHKALKRPVTSSIMRAIKRSRAQRRSEEDGIPELPAVPRATLTGMQTFIQGGRSSWTGDEPLNSTSVLDQATDGGLSKVAALTVSLKYMMNKL